MRVVEIEDTLAYLTGAWALSRSIVDHREGLTGSFVGSADVQTVARRGRYEERGRLRYGRYDGSAWRVLDLVGTNGSVVSVLFADGRPFFELDLVGGSHSAVHQCSADRYELAFEVSSPDLLVERWRVRGPAKDYEARTAWQRQPRA